MQTAQVIRRLLDQTALGVLPKELLTTDRILRRWAVDSGSGLPSDLWDDTPQSRPVPLDEDTWLVVDEQVRSLPPSNRRVVVLWYTKPWPTDLIAAELHLTRKQLYVALGLVLNFLRHKLEGTGDLTLARLLTLRVDAEHVRSLIATRLAS